MYYGAESRVEKGKAVLRRDYDGTMQRFAAEYESRSERRGRDDIFWDLGIHMPQRYYSRLHASLSKRIDHTQSITQASPGGTHHLPWKIFHAAHCPHMRRIHTLDDFLYNPVSRLITVWWGNGRVCGVRLVVVGIGIELSCSDEVVVDGFWGGGLWGFLG